MLDYNSRSSKLYEVLDSLFCFVNTQNSRYMRIVHSPAERGYIVEGPKVRDNTLSAGGGRHTTSVSAKRSSHKKH